MKYKICLHGGAGAMEPGRYSRQEEKEFESALREALEKGLRVLKKNGSATEAVVESVTSMENCPLFNSGKGSVFSHDGTIEMDACLMDGESMKCGGVSTVSHVKNPILAAKEVMLNSPHSVLCAQGAESFARGQNLAFEKFEYFKTQKRWDQLQEAKKQGSVQLDHGGGKGTVGAVAIDAKRNLAAATSTGGMTNKLAGRVSDSSIPGGGTWAQNKVCAFSGTGNGDIFIQNASAKDFAALLEYANFSLERASRKVLDDIKKFKGTGGLVAIDASGNHIMQFNSGGMFRAMGDELGIQTVAIY